MASLSPEFACKVCDSPLRAENVDSFTGMVTCRNCKAMVEPLAAGQPARRRRVALPARMTQSSEKDAVVLTRAWARGMAIFPLVCGVGFFGAAAYCFFAVSLEEIGGGAQVLIAVCCAVLGVIAFYLALANFLNSTVIRAGNGFLTITHEPVLWFWNERLADAEIARIYSREEIVRDDEMETESRFYFVNCKMQDGGWYQILAVDENHPAQALYLEQEIKRGLGRADAVTADAELAGEPAREYEPRFRVALPAGMTHTIEQGAEIFSWKWADRYASGALSRCLFFNAFLAVLLYVIIEPPEAGYIIRIPVALFCAWYTYRTIARYRNSSTVRVGNGVLEVSHGPLPWPGKKRAMPSEIERIHIEVPQYSAEDKQPRDQCDVSYILVNGKRGRLNALGVSRHCALYLEQEIGRNLGKSAAFSF